MLSAFLLKNCAPIAGIIPAIFNFIQEYGEIEDREMYKTFNMGMGMAVIVPEESVDESIKILKKHKKSDVRIVGKIKKGKGVELTVKELTF